MPHDPTTTGTGPWRILVLDRDPADPKWILATVASPADVRPAHTAELDEVTAVWAARTAGVGAPVFMPLPRPAVWRIDEPREGPVGHAE